MRFFHRRSSFDDAMMPDRGLFLFPGGFHLVLGFTGRKLRGFMLDYDRVYVSAKPLFWMRWSVYQWRSWFARGVSPSPGTESARVLAPRRELI